MTMQEWAEGLALDASNAIRRAEKEYKEGIPVGTASGASSGEEPCWPGFPGLHITTWPIDGFWDWSGKPSDFGRTSPLVNIGLPPPLIDSGNVFPTKNAVGINAFPYGVHGKDYHINTNYVIVGLNPHFKLNQFTPPFPNEGHFMGYNTASSIDREVKRNTSKTSTYIGHSYEFPALYSHYFASYMTDIVSIAQNVDSKQVIAGMKNNGYRKLTYRVFEIDMEWYRRAVNPDLGKMVFIAIGDAPFEMLYEF